MSQIAFYWGPLTAIHNVAIALWIGSIFYYAFGLQSCLSLLDPTQKNSLQLQSLRKLFQYSWICGIIVILTQGALFFHNGFELSSISWSTSAALAIIIFMIVLQFYIFTTAYRKARRALRPKPEAFRKISTSLKLIVFLGIINIVLLAF